MTIRLALLFLLCSAGVFAADAILIFDRVFPNLSVAQHIEPILNASDELEGFVLCDTANKALRLVWLDDRPEDTILLPAWPHKAIDCRRGDTLNIYVQADKLQSPTVSGCWPHLVRVVLTDNDTLITSIAPPIYWGVNPMDYEHDHLEYEDLNFDFDSNGVEQGIIFQNRIFWRGYTFTIGPTETSEANALVYSLNLDSIRFRRAFDHIRRGKFSHEVPNQFIASAESYYYFFDFDEMDEPYSYSGATISVMNADASGLVSSKYRDYADVYAIFVGDFSPSYPFDEAVIYGRDPVIDSGRGQGYYIACYNFAAGYATEVWYSPVAALRVLSGLQLKFLPQTQGEIVAIWDDKALFLNTHNGAFTDSTAIGRTLLNSEFFEFGQGLELAMLGKVGDTLFVYRFDAITDADDDPEPSLPSGFSLSQNYPNPFNASTEIRFSLPRASDITLTIYNLLGQEVKTIASGRQTAGEHRLSWDGRDNFGHDCASGIYLYRLSADNWSAGKKMLLLK